MNKKPCQDCTLEKAAELLENASRVALVCHVSPDGDTLGSALAMAHSLRRMGKIVLLTVDDHISDVYGFLPGIEDFRRLTDEDKERADLILVIDASSADRTGNCLKIIEAPVVLNIDHHKTNTRFADYLYLDPDAAATAEIIYDLLVLMGAKLDKTVATCIFEGLYTDTGSFKYSNTTSKTFKTAAAVLDLGIDPSYIADNMEIKSKKQIEMLDKVLETLTFLHDGAVAYVEIAPELYDKNIETDTFISYPRYIKGVEIALLFKQVEENLTRVSFRSKRVDVSKIAFDFGGGGHPRASGCSIEAPLEEAKKIVLEAVEAHLP